MSESTTHPHSSTTTAIMSLENASTSNHSTAAPIIIGASVASAILLVSLVFLSFWIRRRRALKLHYYAIRSEASLHQVSKHDFLPPEPEAPPPYSKDNLSEKDLESGAKPSPPPKDFGKPFVRVRGLSEDSTGSDGSGVAVPPKAWPAGGEGRMF